MSAPEVETTVTSARAPDQSAGVLRHPIVRLDAGHGAVLLADPALASTVTSTLADPRIDAYALSEGAALMIVPLPATVTEVTALQVRLQDQVLALQFADTAVATSAPWLQHPRVPMALAHASLNSRRQPLLALGNWPPFAPADGVRQVLRASGVLYVELDHLPDQLRLGSPGRWAAAIETGALSTGGYFVVADLPQGAHDVVLIGREGAGGALPLAAASSALLDHLSTLDAVQHIRQREALGRLAVRTESAVIASLVRDCQARRALPARIEQLGERVIAALDLALPVGDALLVVGRLDPLLDPAQLAIMPPTGTPIASPLQRLAPDRPEVAALVSIPGEMAGICTQVRGQFTAPNGQLLTLLSPLAPTTPELARAAILAAAPPVAWTEVALATLFGPALAHWQAAFVPLVTVADEMVFGTPPAEPVVSIIVPLYHDYSFLRAQLMAFAVDPDAPAVELLYVLDQPKDRLVVEQLLDGLTQALGVACRLIVLSCNGGYGLANNHGAALARGTGLVLMNSDVVPTSRGWISRWWQRHRQHDRIGASGPKLLYADGSLQHAGLFFARERLPWWINKHYHKGYPAAFPAAQQARAVPGVTGACLMIDRQLFRRLGGFNTGYVIGDFEDSDLCLRLRAEGFSIHYDSGETLFHIERSSMRHHTGYTETAAGRYNGWRQTQIWGHAIERLMADFSSEVPA